MKARLTIFFWSTLFVLSFPVFVVSDWLFPKRREDWRAAIKQARLERWSEWGTKLGWALESAARGPIVRVYKKKAKRMPRVRVRPKLGTPEFLDHGFKDPGSYVETRTGRVVLRGVDYQELRFKVYRRCGGHCELDKPNGKRCNRYASLSGIGHGELAHTVHRKRGGSDIPENVLWSCGAPDFCHRRRDHPGPQWSAVRRRADQVGENSQGPPAGMDAEL